MEYPIAELVDRLTILRLKIERIGEEFRNEYRLFSKEYRQIKTPELHRYYNELYLANGNIWDLEKELKSGKDVSLPDAEIGARALLIRDWNFLRIGIKNKINELTKTGFKEIKKEHCSEINKAL